MVKNKSLLYVALSLIIFAAVFVPFLSQPVKCGIENCHGLDITCGPNVAEMCTAMYAAGDNCRQYASCQTVDGVCTLQTTTKFDSCKSCVETCTTENVDPIAFFECESKCAE